MTIRLEWFGLLALSTALAACNEEATTSELTPDGLAISPGEEITPRSDVEIPAHIAPDLYFVELEEEPTARGGHLDRLHAERTRFHTRARLSGVLLHERYAYTRLWNGLSVRMTASPIAALRAVDGVKAVFPVHTVALDDMPGTNVTPDLFSTLAMTGADVAQNSLGLTGEKVLVGVIDSGVDYHHPDLGGCFGPGCRVALGRDFVGDHFDASDATKLPEPDDDPDDDCNGHGTHVAGILGAGGAVKGVAPGIRFAAYRIFGCAGSTGTDVILKAMETAASDGVRVLNMSLGSPFAWPESPEARAANQLVNDGVVVVASIGNSGDSGLWAAGAPGNADLVLGVASVESTTVSSPAFQISPHATMANDGLIGFTLASDAPRAPLTGSLPLVRIGTVTTPNDGCLALPASSLAGQIALVRRGNCTFFTKATNIQAAGASAVVFFDNQAGVLTPTVAGAPAITLPVVAISEADGAAINAQLDAGPVTLSWGPKVVSAANPAANQMSTFSSLGLTAELGFKPDIAAPGGSIYSTFPLELGGYASLSGTSMASPHLAGTVALLLQARPGLLATEVRDILQNNAVPALAPAPNAAVADNVHRQGAGLVHIEASVLNPVRATPAKIALGESQAGPVTTTIAFTNEGATAVTYAITHVPALSAVGSTYTPTSAAFGYATAVFGASTLTVPADGSASVAATITADTVLADGSLYGGYLVFTPQGAGGSGVIRVPYTGFKGDYQAIQILTPTTQGYPWLADKTGTNRPNGATFTLQSGDTPRLLAHLDHAARQVKLEVFESTKRKPWGRASTDDYFPQNRTDIAVSTFEWRGTTLLNKKIVKVPNGTYVLELSALKALGDTNNPADWEVWTSPVVTLNHP